MGREISQHFEPRAQFLPFLVVFNSGLIAGEIACGRLVESAGALMPSFGVAGARDAREGT
jgi:hypothetical protein